MADPKLYKWGPKGMLVAKDSEPDDIKFTEKADLGLFGGPTSKIVKNLPGYAWGAKEMKAGTKYAKLSDVQALMGGKPTPQPAPNPEPVPTPPAPTPVPPPPPPKAITSLRIQSASDKVQTNVPFTVGHVFKQGDLQAGKALVGMLDDGATIPLQFDLKVAYSDGSAKHGIVSGIIPQLNPGKDFDLRLAQAERKEDGNGRKLMVLAKVELTVDGVTYTADNGESKERRWMFGRIVTELHASQPLRDSKGNAHPHLHARFATRCYDGERTRMDVSIENDWAYELNPQNFTYDVRITVAEKLVYEKKALTHYHHARWRKLFWYGEEPQINVNHAYRYLIDSRALPNYDPSIVVPEKTLADWTKRWDKAEKEPMKVGLSVKGMATTGGRPDIGMLPAWNALWLLTGDKRMRDMALGTADLAGSWSMHYRDKNTDQPVSLIDYPYMTILGRSTDTKNPATKKYEAFPALVKGQNKSPYSHDSAHQPGFAYLPYLMTGDFYYLEELQMWAMYNIFQSNPGSKSYRQGIKGLVMTDQVRGQAWSLRTLAQAAYITPDGDRLKEHFMRILGTNLEWYNATYTYNPEANNLGVFTHKSAIVYKDTTDEIASNTALAPWQDDFVTAAVGYVVDLFPELPAARDFFKWKSKFVIGRFTDPEFNWIVASNYSLTVRATPEGPIYKTFGEVYRDTVGDKVAALPFDKVAEALGRKPNDMGGYPTSTEGFPANAQPAVAYAATYSGEKGNAAWEQFQKRDPKPNYGTGPQFAIVPRSV